MRSLNVCWIRIKMESKLVIGFMRDLCQLTVQQSNLVVDLALEKKSLDSLVRDFFTSR